MEMNRRVTYYSLTSDAETQFIDFVAAQQHTTTQPLFFHECFSEKHPLVFDIDLPWRDVEYLTRTSAARDIVTYLQSTCRQFFDVPPHYLRCVVVEATGDAKLSYHVHFPLIVVNPNIYRDVVHFVKHQLESDGKQKEIAKGVDANLCSTRKLRMVFSDKFNKDESRPAERTLQLHSAYNEHGRIDERWIDELRNSPCTLLRTCSVRCNSSGRSVNVAQTRRRRLSAENGGDDRNPSSTSPPHKRFRADMGFGDDDDYEHERSFIDVDDDMPQQPHQQQLAVDASTEASSVFVGEISYDQLVAAIRNETLHELPEKHYRDLTAISRTVSVIRDHVYSSSSSVSSGLGNMSIDSETSVLVHYMNLFCCAVTDQKGGLVYCIRTYKLTNRKSDTDFQRFHIVQKNNAAFLQYFESVRFPVETGRKGVYTQRNIAQIWLASALRRNVKRIVFDPNAIQVNYNPFLTVDEQLLPLSAEFLDAYTQIDNSHALADCNVNLFDNVSMPVAHALKRCLHDPNGGDWQTAVEPILHHMKYVWCSGDERLFSFLLGWFKHVIFKPWQKTGVAVVLHGSEGCGKSSVITHIGNAIFGEYFYQVTDNEDLTGRFANSMADKLLIFLDEALWGGNKKDAGKVKALLTEKSVRVEFKGVDTYYVDNYSNFIIASNDLWLVPAGANARRWFCLECSSRYNRNTAYFGRLMHALTHNNGFGVAAFVTHLYFNVSLDQFTPHDMPVTELLRIQKEMGLSVMETWWFQILNRGFVVPESQFEQNVLTDPAYPHHELQKYLQNLSFFQPSTQPKKQVQCVPLEVVFNIYREEMYGGIKGSAAVSTDRDRTSRCIQRFLCQQSLWNELPGAKASAVNGPWLIFDITHAKDLWRIRYEDKALKFNSD